MPSLTTKWLMPSSVVLRDLHPHSRLKPATDGSSPHIATASRYIARYADRRIAEVHLDYFGRKSVRTVELYMDDETIVGNLIAGEVRYLKAGRTVDLRAERDVYQKRELCYFIDAISAKKKVHNSIAEAVKVLKLTQGVID